MTTRNRHPTGCGSSYLQGFSNASHHHQARHGRGVDASRPRLVLGRFGLVVAAAGGGRSPARGQPEADPGAGVDRDKDDARINAGVTPMGFNTFPELDYVPITQCRLADTRKTSKLGNGTTRGFYAADKTKIAAQGGNSNGCGIPASAAAVTFTVLVYQPSAAGRLRVWKAGTTVPTATPSTTPRRTPPAKSPSVRAPLAAAASASRTRARRRI